MHEDRPRVLSVGSLTGTRVVNADGEDLGRVEELMLDLPSGRVAYAVLSFGGFLGFGDKLFALPFEALALDPERERFLLDVPRERLEQAEGFDKNDWPDFADRRWGEGVYRHYGVATWW
jgi:sporulation protein YlmC with PRC-barrel domain